jgi:dipeptidyl aminopeptidase/acylaminoacyl peptidase
VRGGEARPLDVHGLTYHSARFVPDGKGILTAASEGDDAVRLWVYPLDGGKPRPVTDAGVEIGPFPVSPDSRHAVVQTSDFAWHLVPLAGGTPQPVLGLGPNDRLVAFSADASALYGFPPRRAARAPVPLPSRGAWGGGLGAPRVSVVRSVVRGP